jgi:hypothetical protein
MLSSCIIDGCDKPVFAKGWCSPHYTRNRRYGDPLIRKSGRGLPEQDRFWEKVDALGPCWLWTGARTKAGYGNFRLDNRSGIVVAHRYAWTALVGPLDPGIQLDHLCRIRNCVNPDHLDPVTGRVNVLRGMSPSAVTYRTNTCRNGHSMDDAYDYGKGRRCRLCTREREGKGDKSL